MAFWQRFGYTPPMTDGERLKILEELAEAESVARKLISPDSNNENQEDEHPNGCSCCDE